MAPVPFCSYGGLLLDQEPFIQTGGNSSYGVIPTDRGELRGGQGDRGDRGTGE